MSKIADSRNNIDKIDDKITKLYEERMALVKEIGIEKASLDTRVLDGNREKEIINRVTKMVNPEIMVYTKRLFDTLFDTSKAYQSRFVTLPSNISEKIKTVLKQERVPFPPSATVACQGVEGAYSHLAAEKLFEISDIVYFKNFEGVFNAVEKGMCEYGILPIENSSTGSVSEVYDLMKKYKFYIVKSIKLPVEHHLLAKKGSNIDDIKAIYSHEQALWQCGDFLKKHEGLEVHISANTATAARMVASSDRTDIAAISSKQCASLYGLAILESNIQNNEGNYTRFICISKEMKIFKNPRKISIMVNLEHQSGSLYKLLAKFTMLGLNLTKLESRPVPGSNFEFLFYFDFEADIENNEVLNLIAELDNRSEQFTFLGSFDEV